jgi:molecular chaperone DnaJ
VVPVSVAQAALGAEIRVPTMDGEHQLKIPEGTQPGSTFRIRHKGVPVLNGHGKGDLFVEVRVQIPARLNKRQKELLQELDALGTVDNQPLLRSLLGKVKDMFG